MPGTALSTSESSPGNPAKRRGPSGCPEADEEPEGQDYVRLVCLSQAGQGPALQLLLRSQAWAALGGEGQYLQMTSSPSKKGHGGTGEALFCSRCRGWNQGRALFPLGLTWTWPGVGSRHRRSRQKGLLNWVAESSAHSPLKEGGSLAIGEGHPGTLQGGL